MQYFTKGGSVMIDYDKLDSLMELPVSEEMIGAYLEGNLHGAELRGVQNIIEKDSFVADLISSTDDAMQIGNDLSNPWADTLADNFCNNPDFQMISTNDFVLPEIVLDMSLGIGTDIIQDTALAQLQGELEDGTLPHSVDEINSRICGCDELSNDY